MKIPSIRLLWALVIIHGLQVFLSIDMLPDPMASHFGLNNKADGYMARHHFIILDILLIAVPVFIFGVMGPFIHKVPFHLLSLPRKEYWQETSERKEYVYKTLKKFIGRVGCLSVLFLIYVFQMVLLANQTQPAELPCSMIWALLLFILILVVGTIYSMRLFYRVPSTQNVSK